VSVSLRVRLMAGTALAVGLVIAATGAFLYTLARAYLRAGFDAELKEDVRALAALVELQERGIVAELDAQTMPQLRPGGHSEFVQVWAAGRTVIYRSPSLGISDLPRVTGPLDTPTVRSGRLPDGRRGRLVGITFLPRADHPERWKAPLPQEREEATLVLGRETGEIGAALARLRALVVAIAAGAIIASAALLALVVRRGLRPVNGLAAEIAGVGEDRLPARIEQGGVPAELMPVVGRLNDLLARLGAAFERERAFSAAVAHELRTPLAGLRATLEVALSKERDPAAYRAALADCLGICSPMETMVNNLLALARADAGQLQLLSEPVGLDELLRECWRHFAARAEERRLRVEWDVDPAAAIETDRCCLRLILQNLLDNAVTYADPGGLVQVQASLGGNVAVLTVANTGSRLAPEQAGHVFERFWRGEAARSDTGTHCGLGLSLCEKLAQALGGSIAVESAPGGLFTARLRLRGAEWTPDAPCGRNQRG